MKIKFLTLKENPIQVAIDHGIELSEIFDCIEITEKGNYDDKTFCSFGVNGTYICSFQERTPSDELYGRKTRLTLVQ